MENIWTFISIFLKDFYNFQFYKAIEFFLTFNSSSSETRLRCPEHSSILRQSAAAHRTSHAPTRGGPLSICHSVSLVHIFTECLHASLNQKTEEGPNICNHQGIAERETTKRRKDTTAPVCLSVLICMDINTNQSSFTGRLPVSSRRLPCILLNRNKSCRKSTI